MKTIRVMLVDDHEMVRSGLATILQIYKDMELEEKPATEKKPSPSAKRHNPMSS